MRPTNQAADEPEAPNDALAKLGAFCSIFEPDGFSFGEWRGGGKADVNGVIEFPYFLLSDAAQKFITCCYADGWVLADLDWSAWMRSTEAIELRDEPERLANASPIQLAKLLTTVVRQDRFCEGSLSSAFDSGLLLAIVRRAKRLATEFGVNSN